MTSTNEPLCNPYYRLTESLKELHKRNVNIAARLAVFGTYQDTEPFRAETTRVHLKTKSHVDKIHHDIKEIEWQEEVETIQLRKLKKHFQSQLASYHQLTQEYKTKVNATSPMHTYQNSFNEPANLELSSGVSPEQQRLIWSSQMRVEELDRREEEIFNLGKKVQEVNDLFEDLHDLAKDQQEDIDHIEQAMQNTRDQVKAGNEEVFKTQKYHKKAVKRKCFLLIGILFGGCIITLVLFLTE